MNSSNSAICEFGCKDLHPKANQKIYLNNYHCK